MGQKTLKSAMTENGFVFGFRAVMSIANAPSEALRLTAFDVMAAVLQMPQTRRCLCPIDTFPPRPKNQTNGVTNHE